MEIILANKFYQDGRGPELQKIHYNNLGSQIIAIDYYNPDVKYSQENMKHVIFKNPQAFMITPEEEFKYTELIAEELKKNKGAIFNLGKSEWYNSFSSRQSQNCNHYRLMFYDDFIDIICEDIIIKDGSCIKD